MLAGMELTVALGMPVLLLASSAGGWALRQRLPERHRTADTAAALQLVMSMMITFAALVLGLLTSAAKSDFDNEVRSLQTFSITLIELNQRLREYGADADPARIILRRYTAAAVADTWRNEVRPDGEYPVVADSDEGRRMESAELGDLLLQVDQQIGSLIPTNALQRQLAPVLEQRMSAVLEGRWDLLAGSVRGVSSPFVGVLVIWLTLAFLMFGLSTSPSRLTAVVIALAAVSVSAALYLIVDYETPITGLLQLPSAPFRDALAHMDRPLPGH